MDRRKALTAFTSGAAGVMTLGMAREALAQSNIPQPAAQARDRARAGGVPALKITDIKVIITKINNANYVNTKVYTSEPGLYGVSCCTHNERPTIVADTINQYLKPLLVGRNCDEIEKIWQELWVAPYWRASVDANNAMAGIDGALWDIMGKRLGVPVYELLGGKVRAGTRMLGDARGSTMEEMEDSVRKLIADGYDHIRVGAVDVEAPPRQPGAGPGGGGQAARGNDTSYIRAVCDTFEHIRKNIGWDVEIGTDVHEHVTSRGGIMLAKAVEQYRPFFMEDIYAPEDVGWYKNIREETSIGIAMGELFVNPNEWLPLVANRYIDFMRMHISMAGGLSLARRVAHCCDFFGVQSAWHGPVNVSPIGHAINMHVDLSIYNFGIAEGAAFSPQVQELFPGCPEIRKGVRYSNDKPGLGIDIDEKVAARYVPDVNGSNRNGHDREGAPMRP